MLDGAYDIHLHYAPDVVDRAQDAFDIAVDAQAAGMAGIGLKSHAGSTVGEAALLNRMYPDGPSFFGSFTMNITNGGINPYGVEVALQMGATTIYFPTFSSKQHITVLGHGKYPMPPDYGGLTIRDEKNDLLPDVFGIVDLIKEYDAVLATGHLAPDESLELLRLAQKRGLKRCILTHPSQKMTAMNVEMQQQAVSHGAMIEHCLLATPSGDITVEELVAQITMIGAEHVILSSDFGKKHLGPVIAGFAHYLDVLIKAGIPEADIRQMIVNNPEQLLNTTLF